MSNLAVGIDIGGTRTKVGLVDLSFGKVTAMKVIDTETKNGDMFLCGLFDAINELQNTVKNSDDKIKGIGIGIPGFVFENGVVDSTYGFLEFMEDYPLKAIIENRMGLHCLLDNDARVVTLGEALYGAGKGYERVLVLTLGTGLGVGFAINGKLNEPLSYAHMAGHLRIVQNDIRCYCGKTGCLESLVSATGLCNASQKINWQQSNSTEPVSAKGIFEARANHNEQATELVDLFLNYLQTGIDNFINIYAPDIIVLGGGVAKGLTNDLGRLHNPGLLNPFKSYQTKLTLSKLNEEAGILGAAALFN
jgi:glucokinase